MQNKNNEDDQRSWEKNGGKDWKDAKNILKDPKELKNKQPEMCNKIMEIKNTFEGINSRKSETEEK